MKKIITITAQFIALFLEVIFPIKKRNISVIKKKDLFKHILENCGFTLSTWYCGRYSNKLIKNLIWKAKYDHDTEALSICVQILSDEVIAYLSENVSPCSTPPQIIAVPGHMEEILQLIRPLLSNFHLQETCNPLFISRPVEVKQSMTKNRDQRLQYAHMKFQAKECAGKNFILLDDVITTGATMKDCVRALHKGGAIHIYSICMAH